MNLEYIASFASRVKVRSSDGYIQLAFKLLGNNIDQSELQSDC